jgi:hypothetical protein
MKKRNLISVALLTALLAANLSPTAAAEDASDIILISPNPHAKQTETNHADLNVPEFMQTQYESMAGMYAFDGVASRLYDLGMLLGDGTDFNLSEIPDRQQACVMVVRMRGEEAAAKAAYAAGETTCPFTDVTDEWAKPYLAWLYEKGIVLGIGEGKFGNTPCSAKEYVTFMLRALGYTVAWDPNSGDWPDVFYEDVLDFAQDIHVWDDRLDAEPTFNRGVMAAVTYQVLAADVKNTEERLLSTLAQSGAVGAEMAEPILALYDRVDAAAELESSAIASMVDGLKLAAHMTQGTTQFYSVIGSGEDDGTDTMYTGMTFDIGLDCTDDKQQIALTGEMTGSISGFELSLPLGMWVADGMAYVDVYGEKIKMNLADTAEMASLASAFGDLSMLISDTGYQYYTITDVQIEELERTGENGLSGTVVVYDASDFMWPVIASLLEANGFSAGAVLTAASTTEKYIDENGVLSGVYNGMYAKLTETNATGVTIMEETLSETVIEYTAWGEDVTLTFPDFSQFAEAPADGQ